MLHWYIKSLVDIETLRYIITDDPQEINCLEMNCISLDKTCFQSKPRHVTPQINHLRKTSPTLWVSTHIYEVSKEIDGKTFIFRVILGM